MTRTLAMLGAALATTAALAPGAGAAQGRSTSVRCGAVTAARAPHGIAHSYRVTVAQGSFPCPNARNTVSLAVRRGTATSSDAGFTCRLSRSIRCTRGNIVVLGTPFTPTTRAPVHRKATKKVKRKVKRTAKPKVKRTVKRTAKRKTRPRRTRRRG